MDKLKKMTSYRLFWPIVCLALVLLFNLIKSPSFFEISIKNGVLYGYLVDIFNRSSELIILAVGMTLCVASSAGTDISVGAIMALSGAVSVYLLGSGETYAIPWIAAILIGLVVSVLCGMWNGFLVANMKIQPMVATLILFTAGRGMAQLITGGNNLYVKVDSFKYLGGFLPHIPVPTPILVAIIVVVGTALGIIAGYFGGVVDAVIMRLSDMMISFPGMVLAIAVAGILGANIKNAVVAIAIVSWTKYARLARSLVLKIKNRDYIAAAKVTGSKTGYILWKYMLPNALPTIVITGATDIGSMMLEIAGLSFLGFGAQSPTAEWGLMLNEGRAFMTAAPWLMIFPGIAIFITVVVFNLLGDSLRDVLDPRS